MFNRICFIGSGNLASALIKGLENSRYLIHVASPNVSKRHENTINKRCFTDNCQAIVDADAIILAVKPHQITDVLEEISTTLKANQIIISLAAGITFNVIDNKLHHQHPMFRAMPNIAASINESATAIVTTSTDASITKQVTTLFNELGSVVYLEEESQIDVATIIAGSSPAFLYLFLTGLIEAGVNSGLPNDKAEILVKQATLGAIQLAKESNVPLETLMAQVTSKKGTTEAGLDVFTQSGFKGIVKQSVKSALLRAKALNNQSS